MSGHLGSTWDSAWDLALPPQLGHPGSSRDVHLDSLAKTNVIFIIRVTPIASSWKKQTFLTSTIVCIDITGVSSYHSAGLIYPPPQQLKLPDAVLCFTRMPLFTRIPIPTGKISMFAWDAFLYIGMPTLIVIEWANFYCLHEMSIFTAGCPYLL